MTNNNNKLSFNSLKQICEKIDKNSRKNYLIISKNNWNKFSDTEKHLINCMYYVYAIDEKYMGNDDNKNKAYIIPYEYFEFADISYYKFTDI